MSNLKDVTQSQDLSKTNSKVAFENREPVRKPNPQNLTVKTSNFFIVKKDFGKNNKVNTASQNPGIDVIPSEASIKQSTYIYPKFFRIKNNSRSSSHKYIATKQH